MQQRKRYAAGKERLARQPQQHGRVFANAPEHAQALKLVERLAQDVDALVFQFVQKRGF